jgi:DNA-directed RNA polymerase specialized sigma24 family protein
MNALNILSKHHKEWLNIVRLFGDNEFAEDVVQDVYLKIDQYNYYDRIIQDGEPNRALMWILLRNTTYRANKTASNDLSIEKVMNLSAEELELPKHESLERIYERIEWEIKSWNWYDQKLWKIYKDERKPMRQIADETGISLKSIFLTIKSCKEKIRQSVGDDYTDFLNEEFELI